MSQVTVTGKYGAGATATATVIGNVTNIGIDTNNEILSIVTSDRAVPIAYDIASAGTLTITVSGNNYTMSVS